MPYCIATDKALISMGGKASIFFTNTNSTKTITEAKVDQPDKVGVK